MTPEKLPDLHCPECGTVMHTIAEDENAHEWLWQCDKCMNILDAEEGIKLREEQNIKVVK